jgi:hypothetical protein
MNHGIAFLTGMGLGAGVWYFFDPGLGRRRRALFRDQLVHLSREFDDGIETAWRDLCNRLRGVASKSTSLYSSEPVSDEVLVARVRSKMGRYTSHPRALEVTAHDGCVTLSGPILAHEACGLLSAVRSVSGVREVDDRLSEHEQAEDLPALQGGRERPGERMNLLEVNWAPATRLLAGLAGAALLTSGLMRRFPVACIMGTGGLALCARAATNQPLQSLIGANGRGARADIRREQLTA